MNPVMYAIKDLSKNKHNHLETLKVIAGPGGGGDARWHMTLQPSTGSDCWHVILDSSVTRTVDINKRERLGHRF